MADGAQGDELGAAGEAEAVEPVVRRRRTRRRARASVASSRSPIAIGQLVALAVVAHVGDVADLAVGLRDALALQERRGLRRRARRAARRPRRGRTSATARMNVWLNSLRTSETRKPERREDAGLRRHDHREAAEQSPPARWRAGRRRRRRGRARSASGGRPRWTVTTRSAPSMFSLTRSTIASRRLRHAEPELLGDARDRRVRRLDVERHRAAEQPGREVAEHDVRVGHRRLECRRGRSRRVRASAPALLRARRAGRR